MPAGEQEVQEIHVPRRSTGQAVPQDEEWFEVSVDGRRRRIRFHDYGAIFDIPGLYEQLFHHKLRCNSPKTVVGLLEAELERTDTDPGSLIALDLGAGNGMVGEELQGIGVRTVVGVDLLAEAAAATARDRPDVYHDYVVGDLTCLAPEEREQLSGLGSDERGPVSERVFNCLTSVAALGFGDIPPDALATAYDMIEPGGWIALTVKEDFLSSEDPSGFARLIRRMLDEKMLDPCTQKRYRHRLSSNGDDLYYVALIATKSDGRRLSRPTAG
jgi:SAM-dependent methyltransferase